MKMFVDVSTVYLCADMVDFRKSINRLAALVVAELELPVLSCALFVFCNKGRDKLKLLYSIVETAKVNGLISFDYIMACLNELCQPAPDIDSLLPWNFKK